MKKCRTLIKLNIIMNHIRKEKIKKICKLSKTVEEIINSDIKNQLLLNIKKLLLNYEGI